MEARSTDRSIAPIRGRDDKVDKVKAVPDRIAAVTHGLGGVVKIEGPPGIGKTRRTGTPHRRTGRQRPDQQGDRRAAVSIAAHRRCTSVSAVATSWGSRAVPGCMTPSTLVDASQHPIESSD